MKGIYLHQKTLERRKEEQKSVPLVIICTEKCKYFSSCKMIYLLDVIVQTPDSKVGNVIISLDAFRVLSSRRKKRIN